MPKTYYIEIERQGCTLALVKVKAESYEEAEYKALLALHAGDDISEITKQQAMMSDAAYIIDENGTETDIDED